MARNWFTPLGWFYRPCSWQGWGITLAALAFCANAFIAIDRNAHSVSDTLYGFFPFAVPTFLLYNWAAARSRGQD